MLRSFCMLRLFVPFMLALCTSWVQAQGVDVTRLPQGSLGQQVRVLAEAGTELSLDAARARFQDGDGAPGTRPILAFGIAAQPQWLHLHLINPYAQPHAVRLLVGTTWTDRIDAYLEASGKTVATWHSGDSRVPAPGLTPGLGYQTELAVPPGHSMLYVRVQSVEPLLVPFELMDLPQMAGQERQAHYGYGFVFGFLSALVACNVLLYLGMRRRSQLLYAGYLGSLLLLNLAYTGHGTHLLWPGPTLFQRYIILVLIVLLSVSGLVFADRFLGLAKHAPRIHKVMMGGGMAVTLCMATLVALDLHAAAVWFTFGLALLCPPGIIALAAASVRRGQGAARYFLAATVFGMAGAITTTLTVLGWIPFTSMGYHAIEYGFLIDATLLTLALASRLRQQHQARMRATHLANHDPLTELHNRRGFLERARAAYSVADRFDRPVSLVLLDLDLFKRINDELGHEAGDRALAACAKLLTNAGRAADVLARWGGEEFILLLPDTELKQACAFAERLRLGLADIVLTHGQRTVQLTASFGVAQRHSHTSLDDLIKLADQALYEAKRAGRNQVMASDPVSEKQNMLFK